MGQVVLNVLYVMSIPVVVAAIALFSGACYRIGGADKDDFPEAPDWLLRGSTRDIGCGLLGLLFAWYIGCVGEWWQWVLYAAIMFAGTRSYWTCVNDWLYKRDIEHLIQEIATLKIQLNQEPDTLQNKSYRAWLTLQIEEYDGRIQDKAKFYARKHWWNWYLVGMTKGLRWMAFFPHPLTFAYAIVSGIAMMQWREQCDNVDEEEFGSGIQFTL